MSITGGSEEALTFGLLSEATDSLDDLDILTDVVPGSAVSVLRFPDGLSGTRDCHAYDMSQPPTYSGWLLDLRAAEEEPCVVQWNLESVPGIQDAGLHLLEVEPTSDDECPATDGRLAEGGMKIDMTECSQLVIPPGGQVYFRLVFGSVEHELNLSSGWNLFALPIAPFDGASETIVGDWLGVEAPGPVWCFDPAVQAYEPATELAALQGYWLQLSGLPGEGTAVVVRGVPVSDRDYHLEEAPGWHLAGVAESRNLESLSGMALPVYHWQEDLEMYDELQEGALLQPGDAYWFFCTIPTDLNPTDGE